MKTNYRAVVILCLCLTSLLAHSNPVENEKNKLVTIFENGIKDEQIHTIKHTLQWSGITDTQVFDVIESKLMQHYASTLDTETAEYAAWLVKALAFSGDTQYLPTITLVARKSTDPKLKNSAETAKNLLPEFTQWNAIISKGTENLEDGSDLRAHRIANMLNSDIATLILQAEQLSNREAEDKPALDISTNIKSTASENEINTLIAIFEEGSRDEQVIAIRHHLRWSGISDPRLYDRFEMRLLNYCVSTLDTNTAEYASWVAKALAFSGNEKYLSTLNRAAEDCNHPKLRRYVDMSLGLLPKHKIWNPVISKDLEKITDMDKFTAHRISNMRNSTHTELIKAGFQLANYNLTTPASSVEISQARDNQKDSLIRSLNSEKADEVRYAAQLIYESSESPVMFDAVSNVLERSYKKSVRRGTQSDAIAWLCKALGKSKDPKYMPLLEKIAKSNRVHQSVREWANHALVDIDPDYVTTMKSVKQRLSGYK